MQNHSQIMPGATDWSGDKDSASYAIRLGLGRAKTETRITERVIGMRICEEPVRPSPCAYRRWYKIQADDHSCVVEIAMECDMSPVQRILLSPLFKAQIEGMLRNLKAVMEKPKEAPRPAAPAPA
jgi:hypothetical protein